MILFHLLLFHFGYVSGMNDQTVLNYNNQTDFYLLSFLTSVFKATSCNYILTTTDLHSYDTAFISNYFSKMHIFVNIIDNNNKYQRVSRIAKRFKYKTCVLFLIDDYDNDAIEEYWKHLQEVWIIMIFNKSSNLPTKFPNNIYNAFNIFVAQPFSETQWRYTVYSSNFERTYKFWTVGSLKLQLPERSQNPKFETIKMAVVNNPPKMVVLPGENNTIKVLGYIGELVSCLSMTLKINFEYVKAEDQEFGSLVNGNWTGMMRLLIDQKADMAAGLTPTNIRSQYVSFSIPLYEVPLKILYRIPGNEEWDFTFFLNPFQKILWIAVFITNLIVSFIILLHKSTLILNQKISVKLKRKIAQQKVIVDLTDDFLLCWPIFTVQSKISFFDKIFVRIVLVTYSIFTTVLLQSYNSQLTAAFSVTKLAIPFTSFDEMLFHTQYFPIIIKGTSIVNDFSTATGEPWKSGWKVIQENEPYSIVKDEKIAIENTFNMKAGFITTSKDIAKILSKNCNYDFALKDFALRHDSFGFLPNSLLQHLVNKKILQLKEFGILSFLKSRYFIEWKSCSNEQRINKPVSLTQIIGPIVLLLIGILLSLVISLFEIFTHWFYKKE